MDDLKIKEYDLYAKILLGIAGICLSVVLGYIQYNIQKEQTANNEIHNNQNINLQQEQNKLQVLKLVNDFLPYYYEENKKGEIAKVIIVNAASKLSDDYKFPDLAQLLNQISLNTALSNNLQLRLSEAANTTSINKEWFCLIGSFYKIEDTKNLRERADKILREIHTDLNTRVYKTLGGVYAVTIGDKLSFSKANEYVQIAQTNNIAKDALSQVNKSWQYIQ
jgi:type II secretory pathway pseudopilin PulG